MPIQGLEEPCGTCGRTSGDHTLREWAACLGEVTTDLPYEPVPDDAAEVVAASMRERFQLDPDLIVADHVIVRAAVLGGTSGAVGIAIPTVLHEFQIGVGPTGPPVTVAKVAFIADTLGMRAYGRLARDSANGAANAGERAA